MARDIDGAIAERSQKLLGLLTIADLDALGVSRQVRRSLVDGGVLIPVHRGVYRHRAYPTSWEQTVLAVVLAAGAGAAASHATATRYCRLDGVAEIGGRRGCRSGTAIDADTEVSVPGSRAPVLGRGVVVHRSRDLAAADVDRGRIIPVTTPARTLIDIAARVSEAQLERVLDDAEMRGLVWRPHLRWRLECLGGRGRTGVPQLRALVDRTEGRPLGDSWLEQEAIRVVTYAGLSVPRCQVNLRRSDRRIARVDLLWEPQRLVVELAGHGTHATRRRRQADAERASALELAGWRVVQFTYEDVVERPDYVVRTIANHLDQLTGWHTAATARSTEP